MPGVGSSCGVNEGDEFAGDGSLCITRTRFRVGIASGKSKERGNGEGSTKTRLHVYIQARTSERNTEVIVYHNGDMPSPRIPPALLYLTVYNPTLQPSEPVASDDEDAEEQAHILFYTSQERAVSRDRMLRQVGLAKALVNFSE